MTPTDYADLFGAAAPVAGGAWPGDRYLQLVVAAAFWRFGQPAG
jgi:hypothetical protein